MEFNKENMRKARELILFTIVILMALWKYALILDAVRFILHIAFPFLLGGAIAFMLNVPMSFLERNVFRNSQEKPAGADSGEAGGENSEGRETTAGRKYMQRLARPLSLVLTICLVLGVIVLVMFVVIPQLGATFVSLGKNIRDFMPGAIGWMEKMFHDNKEIMKLLGDLNMDWDKLLDSVVVFFKSGAGNVLNSTMSAAKSIVNSVATFFIAFVFSCYILLQKEKLSIQVKKVLYAYLPETQILQILKVCSLTYQTFSSFLTGQCVEALILGTMFLVTMAVLRLPYALLVGVLIAFTALIPIFGAFIGCFVGAFLILMVDPVQAMVFVILFLVLQQLEGNLIYPKVVGNSVGLPSIWVLAAVSIGGSLMGIVGMLVFIPLVSVVYTLFRENVYKRLAERKIQV